MTDVKQLITEHLDIWLTAETEKKSGRGRSSGSNDTIYGVQKLRELIISLAIQGKLVPQQIDTDSVIELKSKIDSELKSLVENNQISKKQILKISDENQPYTLPKNWMWNKLANLAVINGGYAFKSTNYSEDGIRVIRISDFDETGLKSNNIVRHAYSETLKNFLIHPNNILMAMTGGTVGKTCFLKSIPEPLISNQRVATIKPLNCISADYVNLVLKSSLTQKVIDEAKNSTNDNISMVSILNLWMPLPSLEEQQRIVEKVDELMQLCDQLEQQQTLSSDAHATLVDTLLKALTESSDAEEFQDNWQRIVANFDVLFTTEYSIDQLKQTVLQLAVMGKLVKQDPSDEPASELLKKIADEKVKLIKEGKIKKSKPLPEIAEDEKPYEIPQGWIWVYLNNIAWVGTGATPSRTNPSYWNPKEISWLSSGETANDFVNETAEKVSALALKETNLTIYPEGSLIVAMYGQGKTRGQITELNIPVTTNQACAGIIPILKEVENRKYIKLFFQKIYDEIRELAEGGAQPNLNLNKIQMTKLPLPPLNEQKRIVEKVNQLFSIIEQLQVLQSKLQTTKLHLADALVANAVEGV